MKILYFTQLASSFATFRFWFLCHRRRRDEERSVVNRRKVVALVNLTVEGDLVVRVPSHVDLAALVRGIVVLFADLKPRGTALLPVADLDGESLKMNVRSSNLLLHLFFCVTNA